MYKEMLSMHNMQQMEEAISVKMKMMRFGKMPPSYRAQLLLEMFRASKQIGQVGPNVKMHLSGQRG